jgi:hypothetical protein
VDAVGDAEDRLAGYVTPRCVGRLGVELADRVGTVREPQREGRHVDLRAVAVDADGRLIGVITLDQVGRLPFVDRQVIEQDLETSPI